MVFYDDQCEICQAFVRWLRMLDRRGKVECAGLDPKRLAAAGLDPEACSRQMHIVTGQGEVLAGWPAVAHLARLFPLTWLIGALGAVPPLRWLGGPAYRWVASHRYGFRKCRGASCRVRKDNAG